MDSSLTASRRLTHINPQFDRYELGVSQMIEWESGNGEKLHGALLLPAGYRKGNRYPLIVYPYGGSRRSETVNHFGLSTFSGDNMQVFATRGYAVLAPDAPQHLGSPMQDLARTILPGVDKVIEMGIADPQRLGVWGHSYGGYTTLSLIVQTTRFKAAVAVSGYGDMVGFYGQMDSAGSAPGIANAEHGQGLLGGPPWQLRDTFINNSPIFFLDRVETPLMLVHGTEDSVVAPFLSDEMFVGLRRSGKEVAYVKYRGEGHSLVTWSYANVAEFWNRMIEWFDHYLKAAPEH
jgi:dipeptidyl aminopeptidase/acylaminoacyl peptidase